MRILRKKKTKTIAPNRIKFTHRSVNTHAHMAKSNCHNVEEQTTKNGIEGTERGNQIKQKHKP